jgi:glycosyltransferase involved in cell wall biosynthesis
LLADLIRRLVIPEGVELLILCDNGESTIGAKRQFLLENATAPWVCFFDDDDLPSPDYFRRIMEVIASANPPEVVGFRLRYFEDDIWLGSAIHSYAAPNIDTPNLPAGGQRQERMPNHLNPVRRELALRAGFPVEKNHGEDADYARALARLNPRETFIDAFLYDYRYRTKRNGEVTNEFPEGRA